MDQLNTDEEKVREMWEAKIEEDRRSEKEGRRGIEMNSEPPLSLS